MKKYRKQLIIIGAVIAIFFLLISCKTKIQYVPVETIKTEYRDRLKVDSVHLYDSIYIRDKGDTVFEYRYKYLYRDKLLNDTVYVGSVVQVPYAVIETKTVNRLYNWQIVLMCLGGICIGYFGYKLFRFFKK